LRREVTVAIALVESIREAGVREEHEILAAVVVEIRGLDGNDGREIAAQAG
jgi:hypothetical protein